jgi:Zn-dependent protease
VALHAGDEAGMIAMGRGLRLGRIFGIDVRVDTSWIFVFLLMTWNLSSLFGRWHPDWSPIGCLALAAVASILFFASVLVHELAHSLVAKGHGVNVHDITLFLFGGVSNLEREPPSPRAEFLTAVVGPIASILLGVGFGLAAAGLTSLSVDDPDGTEHALSQLGPVATMLVWLGPVNVSVGIFNLVPAFPLDGGRMLRAALWYKTRDLVRATLWSSRVGRAIGAGFIGIGIAMAFGVHVPLFGTGLIGGIWLAFIGWFLTNAAARSYAATLVQSALAGVRVEQLMRPTFGWVGPFDRARAVNARDEVVNVLARLGDQTPVIDGNGALVGVLDRADVIRYVEAQTQPQRPRRARGWG